MKEFFTTEMIVTFILAGLAVLIMLIKKYGLSADYNKSYEECNESSTKTKCYIGYSLDVISILLILGAVGLLLWSMYKDSKTPTVLKQGEVLEASILEASTIPLVKADRFRMFS
jgi:hypothetical protein